MSFLGREVSREAFKYIIVGTGGYVIDVGLFNILSIARAQGQPDFDPLVIKTISFIVAVIFTYVFNARWTFRQRDFRPEGVSRILRYSLVNVLGLVITLTPLYISRNILGLTNLVADNISANVIGVGMALLFRFTASRLWVFQKA